MKLSNLPSGSLTVGATILGLAVLLGISVAAAPLVSNQLVAQRIDKDSSPTSRQQAQSAPASTPKCKCCAEMKKMDEGTGKMSSM